MKYVLVAALAFFVAACSDSDSSSSQSNTGYFTLALPVVNDGGTNFYSVNATTGEATFVDNSPSGISVQIDPNPETINTVDRTLSSNPFFIYEKDQSLFFLGSGETLEKRMITLGANPCFVDKQFGTSADRTRLVDKLAISVNYDFGTCFGNGEPFDDIFFDQFGNVLLRDDEQITSGRIFNVADVANDIIARLVFDGLTNTLVMVDNDNDVLWETTFASLTNDFEAYSIRFDLVLIRRNDDVWIHRLSDLYNARTAIEVEALFETPSYFLSNYPAGTPLLSFWFSRFVDNGGIVSNESRLLIQDGLFIDSIDLNLVNPDGTYPTSNLLQYTLLPDESDFVLEDIDFGSGALYASISVLNDEGEFRLVRVDTSTSPPTITRLDSSNDFRTYVGYGSGPLDLFFYSAAKLDSTLAEPIFTTEVYLDTSDSPPTIIENAVWIIISNFADDTQHTILSFVPETVSENAIGETILSNATVSVIDPSNPLEPGLRLGTITGNIRFINLSGEIRNLYSTTNAIVNVETIGIISTGDIGNFFQGYIFDPEVEGSLRAITFEEVE